VSLSVDYDAFGNITSKSFQGSPSGSADYALSFLYDGNSPGRLTSIQGDLAQAVVDETVSHTGPLRSASNSACKRRRCQKLLTPVPEAALVGRRRLGPPRSIPVVPVTPQGIDEDDRRRRGGKGCGPDREAQPRPGGPHAEVREQVAANRVRAR